MRICQWLVYVLGAACLLLGICARGGGHDAALHLGVGDPFAGDPSTQVEKRLDLYQEAGIGILRVDVEWRAQETREGSWQDTPNLALLQLGQRRGFKFKVNAGSIGAPPLWFFQKHPDAQFKNQNGLPSYSDISYWYPGLHELLEDKDDRLFAYMARLGLLSAISHVVVPMGPAGESLYPVPWTTSAPEAPMRFWFYDPNAQADFPRRMRAKYGTLHTANAAWGTDLTDWSQVTIPAPGTRPGQLWRDVLEWYRDSKRDFTIWQLDHYRRLIRKYFPTGPKPQLLILVPGNHITANAWEAGVRSGDGADELKAMCDSEFLLDAAHRFDAQAQYTGSPNWSEVEYLQNYARRRGYHLSLWGENAGNAGDPRELDEEVFANGLYGQEYIGSNLFEADHVTPTDKYRSLKDAHAWLSDVWAGRVGAVMSFSVLQLANEACLFLDEAQMTSLCMQDDANLVLRRGARLLWASNTTHGEPGFCATDEDPADTCFAVFQGDGNLVVYRGAQPLWASGTAIRGRKFMLTSRAPYLEIVTDDGQIIWTAASK